MPVVINGTTGINTDGQGNLTFSGTAQRIIGDFSNAAIANRLMFQTTTTNGQTSVGAFPNGTSTQTQFSLYTDSTITNGNFGDLTLNNSEFRLRTGALGSGTAVSMTFSVNGSERMRIDTSGNVGIGTSSPGAKLDTKGLVRSSIGTGTGAGGAAYAFYQFGTSATATENWHIGTEGDGSFRFYNQSFGAGLERMRIDSSGNLLVNRTSNTSTASQVALSYNANAGIRGLGIQATVQDIGTAVQFINASGTVCGTISQGTSSVAYNTSSDYRLKENIAPMTDALAKVQQLKPCTYNWKVDGSDGEGFIAHELAEICPQAVTGEKDAVDADGNPVYQGIDTSFLVATLTAAIQELKAIVDAQAVEIAQLKGQA